MAELLSNHQDVFQDQCQRAGALFSTAPTAAARLGELELFKGYLSLVTICWRKPRALRPMLEKLDVLLAHGAGLAALGHVGNFCLPQRFQRAGGVFRAENDAAMNVLKKNSVGSCSSMCNAA